MPVQKDPSGRRHVSAEVEVPGTPEQVWRAIATGPGFSSWFVPTRMEEREGGAMTMDFGFGQGMESRSTIVRWDPPHRYVAESADMGPGGPVVATEWIVEARAGGTCIVRVVHSWHADGDEWDRAFEGHEQGWAAFFRTLRLHLEHFAGVPGATVQLMGVAAEPLPEAWRALAGPLGVADAAAGARVAAAEGAPPLVGTVARAGTPEHPEALVRLDAPAPGIAHFFAMPMGGKVYLPVRLYLHGDDAAAVVAREEPRWRAWLAERFPADAPADAPAGAGGGAHT